MSLVFPSLPLSLLLSLPLSSPLSLSLPLSFSLSLSRRTQIADNLQKKLRNRADKTDLKQMNILPGEYGQCQAD